MTSQRQALNRSISRLPGASSPLGPGSEPFLYCLTIFLPPLPVYICSGLGPDFWLNILLFAFGYLPGVAHACWIIHQLAKSSRIRAASFSEVSAKRPPSRSPSTSTNGSAYRTPQFTPAPMSRDGNLAAFENPFEPAAAPAAPRQPSLTGSQLVTSPRSMSAHSQVASQAVPHSYSPAQAGVGQQEEGVKDTTAYGQPDAKSRATPAPPYSAVASQSQRKGEALV